MGLPSAIYSWNTVKALRISILAMNSAGLLFVVVSIVWAIKLDRGFGRHLSLVAPGDGRLWLAIVTVPTVLCSPAYLLGVRGYLNLNVQDVGPGQMGLGRKKQINRLLYLHSLVCLASTCLVAMAIAICFLRSDIFQQRIRDGLMVAIENYGVDVVAKARVDAVQIEFHCCGRESYKDWFHVPWLKAMEDTADAGYRDEYGNEEDGVKPGYSLTREKKEDVPFSCCANDILRPCVHHDILGQSSPYKFGLERRLTISTEGCLPKIVHRARVMAFYVLASLIFLSFYQLILSILSRLVQTAYSNELYIGPNKAHYYVWLLGKRDDTNDSSYYHKLDEENANVSIPSSSSLHKGFDEDEKQKIVTPRQEDSTKVQLLRKIGSKLSRSTKSLPNSPAILASSKPVTSSSAPLVSLVSKSEHPSDENKDERAIYVPDYRPSIIPKASKEKVQEHSGAASKQLSVLRRFSTITNTDKPIAASGDPKHFYRGSLDKRDKRDYEDDPNGRWQTRESGGADSVDAIRHRECSTVECSQEMPECLESMRARYRVRSKFELADAYGRFRGTFQDTLARREARRVEDKLMAKDEGRAVQSPKPAAIASEKSKLMARLALSEVSPSYRLLASFEGVVPPPLKSISAQPPPPPPPPPPLHNSRINYPQLKLRQYKQYATWSRKGRTSMEFFKFHSRIRPPYNFYGQQAGNDYEYCTCRRKFPPGAEFNF